MPSFADLSNEFLAAEFADAPVRASGLGLTEYDDQLDDLSQAAYERRRLRDALWLDRFRDVDAATLSFDDAIDRDLAISILRGRRIVDDFEVWRRQPGYLPQSGDERHLRPLPPPAAADARARRRGRGAHAPIPDNLADGSRNLRPELVPSIFLDRAANQARAAPATCARSCPRRSRTRRSARLAEAGEAAATAYEEYVAFLEEMRPTATGDFRSARSATARCCARRSSSASMRASSARRGRAAYDELAEDLARCARELRGTEDWKQVLDELNEDHPTTPEEMRVGYEEWTERAREYLREHRARALPGGRGVRRRAVAALPAARAGGGVVHVAAAVQRPDARPLLRPVPARRGVGGRGPEAARLELVSRHPDDRRPRGVPRATTGTS